MSSRLPYRAVVLALALVAIGLLFEQLVTLLLMVVIAVIISLPLAAGADWLGRLRVPRVLGVLLTVLLGAAILGAVLAVVVPTFIDQAKDFAKQFPGLLSRGEHALGLRPGTVSKDAQKLVSKYTGHPSTLLGPLSSLGISIASAIGGLVVVLISAVYMAISPEPLVRGLTRLAPPEHREEFGRILDRVRTAWLGWLRGIGLDMLVLGGLLYAGMNLIGLPFAVGFAVFSALMTVIPNYGSVISAAPPILYGLAHSFHQAVLVTVVYVVVNQIEGNLVLPLIMGRQVDVHPALVAIAVLIAGALFGVLGLFIAIPLMSLTIILVQELWVRRVESGAGRGERRLIARRMPVPRGTGGEPSPQRTQGAVYGAIVLGALLIVLGLLVQQLITLLLAVMLTIIISLPLGWFATLLERNKVPRAIGALIAVGIEIAAVAGLVMALVPSISQQVKTLVNSAPGIVHQIEVQIGHLTGKKPGHVATQIQNHVSKYVHDPSQFLGPVASIGLNAATVLGGLVIAVMTAYYMAARPDPLVNGVLHLFPPTRRDDVMAVLRRLRGALLGWVRGVLISMFLVGLLLYLALQLIVGLKFALLFGVISGVAEVVPYLGALASGIPPVAYALTISPGTALEVLAIYVAVHQIEANMIGPLVMARTVHLHPAVIALGVVAVGEVFGLLGLLIAIPILSVVIILVEEIWVRPRERPVIVAVARQADEHRSVPDR